MDFKKIMNFFLDPIKNHYADFNGRSGREEFWMFVAVYFAIYLILAVLDLGMLAMLFLLALLVPSLAIGARRLHDTNLSGWLQLINIVPVLGQIVMIVLMVREGDKGANKYGEPKGGVSATPEATPEAAATVPPDSTDGPNPAM